MASFHQAQKGITRIAASVTPSSSTDFSLYAGDYSSRSTGEEDQFTYRLPIFKWDNGVVNLGYRHTMRKTDGNESTTKAGAIEFKLHW